MLARVREVPANVIVTSVAAVVLSAAAAAIAAGGVLGLCHGSTGGLCRDEGAWLVWPAVFCAASLGVVVALRFRPMPAFPVLSALLRPPALFAMGLFVLLVAVRVATAHPAVTVATPSGADRVSCGISSAERMVGMAPKRAAVRGEAGVACLEQLRRNVLVAGGLATIGVSTIGAWLRRVRRRPDASAG